VLYYSNAAPVSGATFELSSPVQGIASVEQTQSDLAGQYAFSGLSVGTQNLWPQKSGDFAAGISTLDAVYVLESLSGTRTLNTAQTLACDVTGNGALSVLDAVMILQYKAGLMTSFPAAQKCASDWAFLPIPQPSPSMQVIPPGMVAGTCQPGTVVFDPLASQCNGVDFSAVLFGDCTGNWQPSLGNGAANSAQIARSLSPGSGARLGRAQRHGRHLRVPLYVRADSGFQGLDVEVAYDPAVLRALGARGAGAARHGLIATNTKVPGRMIISLASAARLPAGETLLLDFTATNARVAASSIHVTHAGVE